MLVLFPSKRTDKAQLLQASINELEVVIDESNVQISSLQEQQQAAQQRLDTAEADIAALHSAETSLQQQLQSAQVSYQMSRLARIPGKVSLTCCLHICVYTMCCLNYCMAFIKNSKLIYNRLYLLQISSKDC